MKAYKKGNWQEFRREIIELDGGCCTACNRSDGDVVLQVHHKRYIQGKLPWEYAYEDCETLCKGCHAAEHGIVIPRMGWEYVGYDDLGGRYGECQLCGTSLRHQFIVHHETWGTMEVSTYCCDSLTDTEAASNQIDSKKRYEDRKRQFLRSTRWKSGNGIHFIRQSKINIKVIACNGSYKIKMNSKVGKLEFPSLEEAKSKVFEVVESGEATEYLKKRGKNP